MVDCLGIIDESAPSRVGLETGCTSVRVVNPSGKEPDDNLYANIMQYSGRSVIKHLEIDHSSRLTSVWPAVLFPKLESVFIRGSLIERIDELKELPLLQRVLVSTYRSSRRTLLPLADLSLRSLSVTIEKSADMNAISRIHPVEALSLSKWPLRDLSAISSLSIGILKLRLGKLESLNGLPRNRQTLLIGCRKLKWATNTWAPSLHIDMCHSLQLHTLGQVDGLHSLRLTHMKRIDTLDFIDCCHKLEHLTITATKIGPIDLSSLVEHPTLTEVWMGLADRQVAEVASSNRRLSLSNGRVYFSDGCEISQGDYFLLARERLPRGEREVEQSESLEF